MPAGSHSDRSTAPVSYETRDGVSVITLMRPSVLNALNTDLAAALVDAVERAATDESTYAVVVRGAGRAFCSGMDRTALAAGDIGEPFYRFWIRALNGLEDMAKVSIAVLHGYSIGGGLQLAVACDLRLATTDAVIGLGASRHGIIPDGSVLRLARLIGLARAKELSLLNTEVAAEAAQAIALVTRVCAPGDVEAALHAMLDQLRHQAPTANGHIKRLLQESFHADPRARIEDVLRAQDDCMRSWETTEANRAWRDKREPIYYPQPTDRDPNLTDTHPKPTETHPKPTDTR
jgi:enoyl-CoA hydratase/carnithine racemase